jgi:hypothetical protein
MCSQLSTLLFLLDFGVEPINAFGYLFAAFISVGLTIPMLIKVDNKAKVDNRHRYMAFGAKILTGGMLFGKGKAA